MNMMPKNRGIEKNTKNDAYDVQISKKTIKFDK